MIDMRLLFWNLLINIYVLLFPLVRNVLAQRNPFKNILRNFIFALIGISVVYSGYFFFGFLGFSEFQLFLLMVQGIYIYYSYPKVTLRWVTERIATPSIDKEVLKRLNRAFHGNIVEDDFSLDELLIVRRYMIPFTISPHSDNELLEFQIVSSPSVIFSILHLFALYAGSLALDTSINPNGVEIIVVPLIGNSVSAIVSIIVLGAISIIYLMLEFQVGSTYMIEIPLLYRKILKNFTLEKIKGSQTNDTSEDYESELEKARERARKILEKRNTDVLNKKREQIRSKVDGIFEKDTPALENETLERFRLMKSVERILQSTPPWSKVSLKEIAEKAKGSEEDVELIIAGLRQSGDVPGIYDIWTKTYSGSKQSQWYVTELLHNILEKREETDIENIKIFPDGSAEISIKKKKS